MKKIFLATLALVICMSLFSCTTDSLTDGDLLYDTEATEGDDGEVNEDPNSN